MLSWLLLACSTEVTVTIPKATIQQQLTQAFPIERGTPSVASATLADPIVRLPGGDRLEVDVSLVAIVPDSDHITVPEAAAGEGDDAVARAADVLRRAGAVALQAATAPRETLTGDVSLAGTLAYRPDEGAFYLHAPAVSRLHLDGQPEARVERIRDLAEQGATAVLSQVPVYTLDDSGSQEAARLLIREVHAAPDGLKIILGP